jgi:XTP/dITP diphosphohydrolase
VTICFASNNQHKHEEIVSALAGTGIGLLKLSDINCNEELPETSNTLDGNALQNAQYVTDNFQIPCFSDDTGLEVEALAGGPGVYSARYAGAQRNSRENVELLLKNMAAVRNRTARFRTVIALVGLSPQPVYFEGTVGGEIAAKPSGAGGFGYDPVFIPSGHSRTFAEMTLQEKNTMSHRAMAVKKLVDFLSALAMQS